MASGEPPIRRSSVLTLAVVCSKLLGYWLVGCLPLWVSYGISIQIENGSRTESLALKMVTGMSLITTVLTAGAWLLYQRFARKPTKRWAQLAKICLWTAAMLTAYLLVVLMRRNLWTKDQGLSVYAQFLPVVGRVNAEFFSEFNWLTYLMEVIPVMSLLSAAMFHIRRVEPRQGSR